MMRQYWDLKSRYSGCLLFFRLGDFYEMFYEDAERASRLLGLTLTSRGGGGDEKAPMCGVPVHSVQTYVGRLLKAGEKVAICEQVEDPRKAKGLVRRDVVRVLTPGTLMEGSLLSDKAGNYLALVVDGGESLALAWADVSTGEFCVTSFAGPGARSEMEAELGRIRPSEVLAPAGMKEHLAGLGWYVTVAPDPPGAAEARNALLAHFSAASLEPFGVEAYPMAQRAAAGVLAYLRETHKGGLSHLGVLRFRTRTGEMRLDGFTIDALGLAGDGRDGEPGLESVMDQTLTAMGARTLREWVMRPLAVAGGILDRLDAVEWLVDNPGARESFRRLLDGTGDLERIAGRIAGGTAGPRDLVGARDALVRAGELGALMRAAGAPGLLAAHASGMDAIGEVCGPVSRSIVDAPPIAIRDGGLIRDGFDAEVDELRSLSRKGKETLLAVQARERERTGIENLRVEYNNVFGYFIEVARSKASKVPADYQRKQTLSGSERYVTPELKELEGRILGAHDRLYELEYEIFRRVRDEVALHAGRMGEVARHAAHADVFCSFAESATRYGYVRPRMATEGVIEIEEGRHPVLERVRPGFVANDVRLSPWQEQIMVITGPNMAGKSTFLRQVALITLMAHTGSFVPARSARIGIVDGIYCRIGASDRLARGQSTFMVEMTEVAQILNHATERSLLVFDEVGRGTSTYDGISIAWAIIEHVARQLGAKTLFATHYYELTALADRIPSVRNLNVLVREWKGKLVFLYRIAPGRADRSYGVQVARLAGLAEGIVTRARELLRELEKGAATPGRTSADGQLSLFEGVPDPVRQKLVGAQLEEMTPLDALNMLHELRDLLDDGQPDDGKFSDA